MPCVPILALFVADRSDGAMSVSVLQEASRLEVPHKSILSRPVKAQALYKACHRDDDVSSNGRCASEVKDSKRIKQKSLDREFALRHPIASCLYVDDNKVNVKVGCRLLESLVRSSPL